MPRKGFSSYQVVFSRASTSQSRFFAAELPVRSGNDTKSVRVQVDVYCLTADLQIDAAFQESDDPENWPSPSSFSALGTMSADADGLFSNGGYESVTITKAYWRPGVSVKNKTTGNRIEFAQVSMRVDARAC